MDDLISRNAALQTVGALTWAGARISKLPSAQFEHPKGKWVPGREIAREYYSYLNRLDYYAPERPYKSIYEDYKCSCCGLTIDRLLYDWKGEPFYKFCPNCGAEMEETDGEELH